MAGDGSQYLISHCIVVCEENTFYFCHNLAIDNYFYQNYNNYCKYYVCCTLELHVMVVKTW